MPLCSFDKVTAAIVTVVTANIGPSNDAVVIDAVAAARVGAVAGIIAVIIVSLPMLAFDTYIIHKLFSLLKFHYSRFSI